jgi:hypothetical protein
MDGRYDAAAILVLAGIGATVLVVLLSRCAHRVAPVIRRISRRDPPRAIDLGARLGRRPAAVVDEVPAQRLPAVRGVPQETNRVAGIGPDYVAIAAERMYAELNRDGKRAAPESFGRSVSALVQILRLRGPRSAEEIEEVLSEATGRRPFE